MVKALVGLLVMLLVAWLVLRLRNSSQPEQKKQPVQKKLTDSSPFHAVSIKAEASACDAAKALVGKRYLSEAAPRLPLPECDVATCTCRFVHHADRRTGRDRRSPFAPGGFGGGTGKFAQERRGRPDRRKDDDAEFF